MKNFKNVVLIDDDFNINLYHKIILQKTNLVDSITIFQDARLALEKLATLPPENKPDIIFLDLNMPSMNGFQFIKEYIKFDKSIKAEVVINLITTYLNQEDYEFYKSQDIIKEIVKKPLNKKLIENIFTKYFPKAD